jgi:hypothetical protein
MLRVIALALVMVGGLPAWGAPQGSDRPGQPVQVTTRVNRTAVWVGDPIELIVEFVCAPQVDVIEDDLAREKLKLEGLAVVTASSEREVAADGVVKRRFLYGLISYEVNSPTLRVGGWPVRYYIRRTGERPEDARAEGELQVPGVAIAWRSTLPDEMTSLDLRALGPPTDLPDALDAARLAGIGLIVLAAAPLAVWTAAMIGRWRSRERRTPARVVRAHARSALEELRALDATTESARRDAYGRLERAIRQHLADTRAIPAHALASGELASRLRAAGWPDAEAAGALLGECVRARYGPPDQLPPKERFGAALDAAERMLAGSRA